MIIIIVAIMTFVLDVISKALVSNLIYPNDSISVIGNFFMLTYVKNTGAAFSILPGRQIFLIIISIIVMGIVIVYLIKNKDQSLLDKWGYGLLLGGTIGNLLDRIRLGYVIDFLDFNILSYHFPIFNIADIGIVIGLILLVISTFIKK